MSENPTAGFASPPPNRPSGKLRQLPLPLPFPRGVRKYSKDAARGPDHFSPPVLIQCDLLARLPQSAEQIDFFPARVFDVVQGPSSARISPMAMVGAPERTRVKFADVPNDRHPRSPARHGTQKRHRQVPLAGRREGPGARNPPTSSASSRRTPTIVVNYPPGRPSRLADRSGYVVEQILEAGPCAMVELQCRSSSRREDLLGTSAFFPRTPGRAISANDNPKIAGSARDDHANPACLTVPSRPFFFGSACRASRQDDAS